MTMYNNTSDFNYANNNYDMSIFSPSRSSPLFFTPFFRYVGWECVIGCGFGVWVLVWVGCVCVWEWVGSVGFGVGWECGYVGWECGFGVGCECGFGRLGVGWECGFGSIIIFI
ncbi:hypothetical protein RhiirA4_420751 [Rhizophagus irregularis]|uniref:Uncharacterized protein n=1 Tax=Rhizophagus irregularis TaxID=588596 RepID=A0A2I1GJ10_9GLOM|nr:hypothetical protein RhiirA4_420751 [Rhizophagus irregularis]